MSRWLTWGGVVCLVILAAVTSRFALSRGRPSPVVLLHPAPLPRQFAFVPASFDGHLLPPAGTPSNLPFVAGADRPSIGPCNCFASVDYLLTGDPTRDIYHDWPAECLGQLDEPDTWMDLESTLHPGDVVEFRVTTRTPAGTTTSGNFHAQLCVALGGVMAGANNTPAFDVVHGIPIPVHRWDLCTSRDYYLALRGMDHIWRAAGYEQRYSVVLFRRPE